MPKKTIIGHVGHSFSTIALQPLGGMLNYCREHSEVELRDFSIDTIEEVPDSRAPAGPPWKGLVDGLIVATGFVGDKEDRLDWIARGGVPAVAVTSDLIDPRLPAVFTDPVSLARLAVKELRRCGCRQMVFVGSTLSMASSMRSEVFRAEAERAGAVVATIDLPYQPVELNALDAADSDPELRDLLRPQLGRAGPVGVFTLNDYLARFVVRVCEGEGIDVPEQVAVVGPDDTPLSFDCRPTITGIRSTGQEIGYRAMEVLLRQIATGRRRCKPVLVPRKELVRRRTTGADVEPDDLAVALELIQRQACSGRSIQEIVEELPIARRTLERQFRERLGRTPMQEILRLRLVQVRLLLADTRFTIKNIARHSGFHDNAALSKFFRDQTGLSPSEFRRQKRASGGV